MTVYLLTYLHGINGEYGLAAKGLGVFSNRIDAESAISDILNGKENPKFTKIKNKDDLITIPNPNDPNGDWIQSENQINKDNFEIIELPYNPIKIEDVEPISILEVWE